MRIRSLLLFTSIFSLAIFGCSSSSSPGDTTGGTGGTAGVSGGAGGAHQGGAGAAGTTAGAAGTLAAGGASAGTGGEAGTPSGNGEAGEAGAGGEVTATPISNAKRVLLISVDGMHQLDLANWLTAHPTSTLAQLAGTGVEYTAAHTTTPSDSFPGLLALVTGGTPKSTGVYYDDSYDRTLYAPGSNCTGNPGTEIVFDESIEYDSTKVFSGGINAANLPFEKTVNGNCKVVYPHDFIKVNTVFEVIRAAGGYTAWSDKHAAYDLVNGPSGEGVDDLYTPEQAANIQGSGVVNGVNLGATLAMCDGTTNSLPTAKLSDFTTCQPAAAAYDDVKVQALINQIDGKLSDGSGPAPVPTIFGMNFQQLSIAEKLPVGGYTDGNGTPSTLLASALNHVDVSLGKLVTEPHQQGLARLDL